MAARSNRSLLGVLAGILIACVVALSGCSLFGPSDVDTIHDAVESELSTIKSGGTDDMVSAIEEQTSEYLTKLGLDSKEYLSAYLEGFDYSLGDITIDESAGTAVANVQVACKSMTDIVSAFQTKFNEGIQNLDGEQSEDDLLKLAGQYLLEATSEATPKTVSVSLDLTKDGDQWSFTDDAGSTIASAIFGSTE